MRSPLLSVLFMVYCIEMGIFLLLWPWSPTWDRTWSQLPWLVARHLGTHPLLRSAISAFGVVHLVWGAHDLDLWIRRRLRG